MSSDFSDMRVASTIAGTMGRVAVVGGALLIALLGLVLFAPGYLTAQGFPLDDSWIHAVYGREFARAATLSYNPGIPAAGETSPLWAVVVALPHVIARDPWLVAILIKAVGFGLHVVTVLLALRIADALRGSGLVATTAAVLVALHPDLLAAAVSGMEVPLATALALWVVREALRGPSWRLALACFLAPLGRPEVACVGVFAVGAMMIAGRPGQLTSALAAAGGALTSSGLVALRNLSVTGRPMPSTFYAKVTDAGFSRWFIEWFGFRYLLDQIVLANIFLLAPLALFGAWLLLRSRLTRSARPADGLNGLDQLDGWQADAATAAVFFVGIAFFAVSFALVPPFGVQSFYFQRYSLPGLPLVLVALPLLIDVILRAAPASRVPVLRIAVSCALAIALLAPMPARLWRLSNDARNIDDVQVAEGRALADAAPDQIVWAIDAGAIRYFGGPFVVDMIGLNTPEMLSDARESYLDHHRPHFISTIPGWYDVDPLSANVMPSQAFAPTTTFTITMFTRQAVHVLRRCPPQPHSGLFGQERWKIQFQCGAW